MTKDWVELEASVEASLSAALSVVFSGSVQEGENPALTAGQWTGRLAPVARSVPGDHAGIPSPSEFVRYVPPGAVAEVSSPISREDRVAEVLRTIRPEHLLEGSRLLVFRVDGIRYAVVRSRVLSQGKLNASHWLKGRVFGPPSFGLGGAKLVDFKRLMGFEGTPGGCYLIVDPPAVAGGPSAPAPVAWAVDGIEGAQIVFQSARWREPTPASKKLGVRRVLPGASPIALLA